ncbi:MAG: glyceraldehyde 3-phosphate dehydrogenase NAD-binding domain-containing protein [Patescibacteria group bacterium]
MKTLAINGFGRIGRVTARILLERNRIDRLQAVNDLADAKTLAYLLKYDTIYRELQADVREVAPPGSHFSGGIRINHHVIGVLSEKDPALLPWKALDVGVVIEATGRFTDYESASAHLKAGARQVIISAPSRGVNPAPTSVIGVNAGTNDDEIINNASCTTNCISPMMAVLEAKFGVEKALLTTIHAYTQSQLLQDGPSHDLREGRAASANLIPAGTGAAIATTEAIPTLKNKFDGVSIRVPVTIGSLSDVTLVTRQPVTVEEVNQAFTEASHSLAYKGILEVTDEPLVSGDIIGRSASAIVDLSLTRVVGGNLVKVFGWYDNEWGYANRLVDQAFRFLEV